MISDWPQFCSWVLHHEVEGDVSDVSELNSAYILRVEVCSMMNC
jgi:hypothetical protein